MNSRFRKHILPTITTALALVYAYIGWTDTFYRMGIFFVPLVLIFAAGLASMLALFVKLMRKHWASVFYWGSSLAFATLVAAHIIENYKPTFIIHIPENYEGMVYLFPSKETNEALYVDQNGIGYYMPKADVSVKILHGDEDISNALNQYGSGTIQFPLADSIHYEAIDFTCFEVEKGRIYGSSPWNQPHAKCMEKTEFTALIAAGIIDEKRIKKEVWPK